MIMQHNRTSPLIGIIVPVYNGERFLSEAITSVLNQPCKNLMVIIVDDGSTDNSKQIAEQLSYFDERVLVISQCNRGVSVARNRGIEMCIEKQVDYIAFLDADDVWCDNFYDEEMMHMVMSCSCDLIQFNYMYANPLLTRGRIHENDASTGFVGGWIAFVVIFPLIFTKHP